LFGIFVNQFAGVFWWDFWGVFVNHLVRDFCGIFGVGSFWGFWYIHGYLIRYIFFDNKRSSKDKRKGTV